MNLKIGLNTILYLVVLYPLILLLPSFFGYNPFFLTAPYFFLIFSFFIVLLIIKGKLRVFRLMNVIIGLIIIGIFNFTSLRFSLPLFFLAYILILNFLASSFDQLSIKHQPLEILFYFYILLSIPFLFFDSSWDENQRFAGFISSPTVYSGFMVSLYILVVRNWKIKSYKFILTYLIVFAIIYITKTRLLLIFMVIFPLIKIIRDHAKWFSLKLGFFFIVITMISVYPMYNKVVEFFPNLVNIRYEEGSKDKSFGLRLYLHKRLWDDYKQGTLKEKVLGKGNEYSRNFVAGIFKFDIFPHNDFLRLLADWGIIGIGLFLFLLYKYGTSNEDSFYLCFVYIVLFYSNLIFNLFLISLIIIFYYNSNTLTHSEEN